MIRGLIAGVRLSSESASYLASHTNIGADSLMSIVDDLREYIANGSRLIATVRLAEAARAAELAEAPKNSASSESDTGGGLPS